MLPDPPLTIPIVIDSQKTHSSFEMTRCSYLSIESTHPLPNWQLGLEALHLPILLLNLEAVIVQPFSPQLGAYFSSPQDLEDLFRRVEAADLGIVVEELWLPNFSFLSEEVRSGQVYRILPELFASATAFRDGRLDHESFLASFREFRAGVIFSEEETRSLAGWWAHERKAAVDAFPKSSNLKLEWRSIGLEGETE